MAAACVVAALTTACGGSSTTGASGYVSVYAGDHIADYSGDSNAAASAAVNWPTKLYFDGSDNLYIADAGNGVVRKVTRSTLKIATVAGIGGSLGYAGDGATALQANLQGMQGFAMNSAGDMYFTDSDNAVVRRIDGVSGVVSTVAGTGAQGYNGDGVAAATAQLRWPAGLALDAAGNLFIADVGNNRIRRVDAATGRISTYAGTGVGGYAGDSGAAASAKLYLPYDVAFDGSGNLYVADAGNAVIRKIAGDGVITTVAGNGSSGYSGDGSAATSAALDAPRCVAVDGSGNIYICDVSNAAIRKVDVATGRITTVVGVGAQGYNGEGLPATKTQIYDPTGIAFDSSGNMYFADSGNSVVRKVNK